MERLEDRSLLAAGLVSHWTGDNTAADAVGTNHGTLINGTTYVAGQVGQAFSLDGIDDRIGVADSSSCSHQFADDRGLGESQFLPSRGSGSGLILFRGDDREELDPYSLALTENGVINFQINSLAGGAGLSAHFPLGQFVHVAGTLDDATGEMKLYLNGSCCATRDLRAVLRRA